MTSPYRLTNIPDHGSASAIGLKPLNIVTKWFNNNFSISIFDLPVKREFAEEYDTIHIKCLSTDETKCWFSFPDELDKSNVIDMFKHLYVRHAAVYDSITKDFNKWVKEKTKSTTASSSPSKESITSEDVEAYLDESSRKRKSNQPKSNDTAVFGEAMVKIRIAVSIDLGTATDLPVCTKTTEKFVFEREEA